MWQKTWKWLLGAFALLAGLFIWETEKNNHLETELSLSKFENKDNPEAEKQAALQTQIAQDEKKLAAEKPPTSVPELSPDGVQNYWNTKK